MAVDLSTGVRIGRYQLLFRLGRGGMGEVWAARQTAGVALGFRKVVALKVLRDRDISPNATLMFLDEAKAASVLQHPSIVPTVDLGRHDGLLFIAMDLVQGPSLTTLLQQLVIDRGRMRPGLVAYLGARLAGALDYAHSRAAYHGKPLRLVHRDVSPHNILLDVHSGEVRLTDFGVARTSIQDHESRIGTIRGKPSYMAPEQVVGDEIDHRSDLFALGVVLYESACLKRLFGRQNPVKSMDAVIKHTPKPLGELIDGFPPALARIIHRALEKDPERRWPSASAMHCALLEAARDIEQTASPSHELTLLIDRHFEKSAFDLDARLRHLDDRALPLDGEPTAPDATKTPGEPSTEVFWPSDHAPDPLAPEAIEAARTRCGRWPTETPARFRASLEPTEAVSPRGSTRGLFNGGSPRGFRASGPAAVLTVAATLSVVVAAGVTLRAPATPGPIVPIAPIAPPIAPIALPVDPAPPPPAPVARAKPRPLPPPAPAPAESTPAKKVAEPSDAPPPVLDATPPRRREAVRAPRGAASRIEVEPAVTYEEVHRLLQRVKALDEVRGTLMIVTLAEAGRNNADARMKLHRQARAFLRSRGRAE